MDSHPNPCRRSRPTASTRLFDRRRRNAHAQAATAAPRPYLRDDAGQDVGKGLCSQPEKNSGHRPAASTGKESAVLATAPPRRHPPMTGQCAAHLLSWASLSPLAAC
jgi:hypothetical protein